MVAICIYLCICNFWSSSFHFSAISRLISLWKEIFDPSSIAKRYYEIDFRLIIILCLFFPGKSAPLFLTHRLEGLTDKPNRCFLSNTTKISSNRRVIQKSPKIAAEPWQPPAGPRRPKIAFFPRFLNQRFSFNCHYFWAVCLAFVNLQNFSKFCWIHRKICRQILSEINGIF